MKTKYDREAHCGYVTISGLPVAKTLVLSDRAVCDIDDVGTVAGIEFTQVSEAEFLRLVEKFELVEG